MAEAKKRNRNEAQDALESILERYPKIRIDDVARFAPVYYPIAMVEIHLDEKTFEDFETVQLTVLKLASLGILDSRVVARTLGMSPNYVHKIQRLLQGFGHLDSNGVTDIGRESLHSGKKVIKNRVWQKFQVDALNGTLLKVAQTVTENTLSDKESTNIFVGHLDYIPEVSLDKLSSQISGVDAAEYIRRKTGIQSSNIMAIHDARCQELKYAKCYLLKLRSCEEPLIFGKRFDSGKRDVKDRFSWQPFSVRDPAVSARFGFEADTPVSDLTARAYVDQVCQLIQDQGQRIESPAEEVTKAISWVYPFRKEEIRVDVSGRRPVVTVDENALTKYRGWLLKFLRRLADKGEYLVASEVLAGYLILVRSDSSRLKKLGAALDEKARAMGEQEVSRYLREKLSHREGEESLIDVLEEELKNMK